MQVTDTGQDQRVEMVWGDAAEIMTYVDVNVNAELPPLLIFKDVPIR